VVITHNAGIGRLADRVLRMRDGRIVEDERHAVRAAIAEVEW
jgi:putative ABC transport system ATP-binding protein